MITREHRKGPLMTIKAQFSDQIRRAITESGLTKQAIAAKMGTSVQKLNRLIDQRSTRITVEDLAKLCRVLDCRLQLGVMVPRGW